MARASVCCPSPSTPYLRAFQLHNSTVSSQHCRVLHVCGTRGLEPVVVKTSVVGGRQKVIKLCFSLVCSSADSRRFCPRRSSASSWNGRVRGPRDSKGSRGRRVGSGISEHLTDAEESDEDAQVSTSGASVDTKPLEWIQRAMCFEESGKYLVGLALPGLALPLGLEGPQSFAEALGVLAAIVTVHEAGHFLAARLQGIHVTQFAIGFGPPIAKFKSKNVEYSLRAVPLGGYVGFPDDDPESVYEPDDPDLLKNRSIPERALVISAGVIANIIFAYTVLFGQVVTVGLLEQEFLPGVVIHVINPNSAAALAGIEPGDVVAGVNGHLLGTREASVRDLLQTIKDNPQKKLNFLVIRNGSELVNLDVTPNRAKDGGGRIGVQLSANSKTKRVKAANLADASLKATKEFTRLLTVVTDGLKQVFLNFAQTADKLSGPVAILAAGAEVARNDIAGLFQFAAIVNINLAVVNLLPLPALDGGYLFLIALEALRGKKLPEGVEQGIMSSGFLLLLAVGIVLIVRDTLNLGIMQPML
ncbi:uncharacterized protein [Physcomitrium patens]|uniref:PDZ domain-containing protein n=1 Tax=Physcomitrium patens TaxID=3218 RepID=A0A2K1IYZ3_PHYPA|nr:uncharacterized protein LOC112296154 [Physcomitrium patens]PNR34498.1 hypothetical protein PHYPA_024315 [Physcomitrium patens]|eukprot:XP_024404172.1 uncharacterized protein LOC112296154 [Physcomitrella patens]